MVRAQPAEVTYAQMAWRLGAGPQYYKCLYIGGGSTAFAAGSAGMCHVANYIKWRSGKESITISEVELWSPQCGEMKRKDAFTKAHWKQETYRVCKECTAQKREAGTPYRCTQCGLWHAATHFASKHHNPRWSMYRVCLTCDAVKQCFICKTKQTQEYFGTAAWKAREPKRRVCLQCQTKTRGSWTRTACQQRKPQQQFSIFISTRPAGKSGAQMCNTCRTAIVQDAIRKRAATSATARLEPLRKRARHMQVLRDTWEAIARNRGSQKRQASDTTATPVSQTKENTKECQEVTNTILRAYVCPACGKATKSTIITGKVLTQGHCGRCFRVKNGAVCRQYTHYCPACNTKVTSTKSHGRIQSKHRNDTGRYCKTYQWTSAGPK